MASVSEHIQDQLKGLPPKPGVYLLKNADGDIIYVGKAINLRNRVRSYFQNAAEHSPKTRRLAREVADIEFIVVTSELEALLLELQLIKKHRPRYNVRLKDDKRYPYIKVTVQDPFPKVTVTRRMEQDGARYFGPYTSVWAVHQTLDLARKIFPYLTCDRTITGRDERACLYYDLKLCLAPCIGAATQAQYREMIAGLCLFLEGQTEPVVRKLRAEMEAAAEAWNFERAAQVRDQIAAIERVVERQKVISSTETNQDVIAFARADGDTCVQVFFIRAGKLIGRETFVLEGAEDEDAKAIMASFLKQFYDEAATIPPEVLLPEEVEEFEVIQKWLASKRRGKVTLRVPRQGQGRELVEMAAENAADTLAALRAQWQADTHKQTTALTELQETLGLPAPPMRIECYDISNTQGVQPTGSMVVFIKGVPRKSHYRRFNIRTVQGPNDFDSMREVLERRFRRWQESNQPDEEGNRLPGDKGDESFRALPDLLIVDGGRGQLNVAVQVLEAFGLRQRVPVVALAKQQEEVFIPGRADSLLLPRNSQGLFLLQRIRDEAHRFALSHHRTRRTRVGLASQLEAIKGVGAARRKALLARFGSLEAIRAASVEDLTAVPGIPRSVAEAIKDAL
ncbi:MAG: excinuclease ABC subunit C [Chloroflexota bacterium]